jgi:O-antigen ligase
MPRPTFEAKTRHPSRYSKGLGLNAKASERDRQTESEATFRSDLENPWRIRCLYCVLALVFIRCSLVHEALTHQLGFNIYPLYFFGIPAIAGVFLTGGLRRVFQFRTAVYWTLFGLWLVPAAILSIWRGGSFTLVTDYLKTDLIMLFVVSGLVMTWEECKAGILVIAAATVTTLGLFVLFAQKDINGRTNIEFGIVSNSNDYACHLILLLPFLLWVVLSLKSTLVRFAALLTLAFGVYQVLASGSRGALIATGGAIITYVLGTSRRQRIIAIILIPALMIAAFNMLPSTVVQRIFSFSESNATASAEALESSRIRQRLLHDSIVDTFYHPLFGVGPGQFSTAEGTSKTPGQDSGLWFEAHNSYTQVSSETGLPGFAFFMAGLLSTALLLNRVAEESRGTIASAEIRNAVLCLRIAIVGFCIAIFFLNFAYTFYLPTLAGLTMGMAWGNKWLGQAARPAAQDAEATRSTQHSRTLPKIALK